MQRERHAARRTQGDSMNDLFRRFAAGTSCVLGSPWAFLLAIVFVLVWVAAGPYFDYSNSWQLVINTSTTIGTFLMVFLLQSTQNRDTKAINIKLDELLRAIEGARTGLVNLSELSDEELDKLEAELLNLGRRTGVDALPTTAAAPCDEERARAHSADTV
jgi:low affinity Fe/Cu permease